MRTSPVGVNNVPIAEGDDILFNSLNPHFSLQLFFEQLLFHILFPFSLPFFVYRYGWTVLYAHGILPIGFGNVLGNWGFSTMFYLGIITAQYLPQQIGNGVFVPICIYLIHRFMVALKYGTLSISEYSKFLDLDRPGGIYSPPTEEYLRVISSFKSQLQIISGWSHIPSNMVSYELHAAAKRLDIDLHSLSFYVPIPSSFDSTHHYSPSNMQFSINYQYELWKDFLLQDDFNLFPRQTLPSAFRQQKSQEYILIDCYTVCLTLFSLCNHPLPASILLPCLFIATIFACLPLLFIICYPSLYSYTSLSPSLLPYFIIFHVSCFTINFLQFQALTVILFVCIIDAYRKYSLFTLLSSLIRIHDIDMELLHVNTTPPALKLLQSQIETDNPSTNIPAKDLEIGKEEANENKVESGQKGIEIMRAKSGRRNWKSKIFATGALMNSQSSIAAHQLLIPHKITPQLMNKAVKIIPKKRKASILLSGAAESSLVEREREENENIEMDENENKEDFDRELDEVDEVGDEVRESESDVPIPTRVSRGDPPDSDQEKDKKGRDNCHPTSISSVSSSPDYRFKAYVGEDRWSDVPRIDFEVKSNFFSWCSIRLVLHGFGERMKYRIDSYLVLISFFMFLLMVDVFLTLYGGGLTASSTPSLLIDPIFWQSLLCVFVCLLLMCVDLCYLYLVNTQMRQQRGRLSLLILSKYRYINQLQTLLSEYASFILSSSSLSSTLRQRKKNSSPSSPQLEAISKSKDCLTASIAEQRELITSMQEILDVLDRVDEMRSSRLAGFTVERQHIVWVMTTLSLFSYSLLNFILKDGTQK